jgi:hypothetical protein
VLDIIFVRDCTGILEVLHVRAPSSWLGELVKRLLGIIMTHVTTYLYTYFATRKLELGHLSQIGC